MNAPNMLFGLTIRQKEIAECFLKGMSIQDIAHQLGISIVTVRTHQDRIQKKMCCKNAYQLGYKLGCFFKTEQKILNIYSQSFTFEDDQ